VTLAISDTDLPDRRRGVILTEAGRSLLPYPEAVLASLSRASCARSVSATRHQEREVSHVAWPRSSVGDINTAQEESK